MVSRERALPWISLVARLFTAGVFIAAGWPKAHAPAASVRAVRAYQILPETLVHPFAYALPWIELALAVLLILGLASRVAAAVCAVLLVTFIAAVASAGLRGLKIDCGCFGGGGTTTQTHYLQEIARDLGMLAVASTVVVIRRSRFSLDNTMEL